MATKTKQRRGYTFFLDMDDIKLVQAALKSYKAKTPEEEDLKAHLLREIREAS